MHIIRLRGPWQLEPVYRFELQADGSYQPLANNLPAAARMTIPADWSEVFGSTFLGRVRYVRTFNSPPGLQFDERVWLVVEPQRSLARVIMLEETMGVVAPTGTPQRFDITHRLGPHNRLEIIVDHPVLDGEHSSLNDPQLHLSGGLVGEVRLEIEAGQ